MGEAGDQEHASDSAERRTASMGRGWPPPWPITGSSTTEGRKASRDRCNWRARCRTTERITGSALATRVTATRFQACRSTNGASTCARPLRPHEGARLAQWRLRSTRTPARRVPEERYRWRALSTQPWFQTRARRPTSRGKRRGRCLQYAAHTIAGRAR